MEEKLSLQHLLPEEVISYLLNLCMSPVDLCRLSEVSLFFYRLSGSDSLWFLKCRERWEDKQNHSLTPEWSRELWQSKKKWKFIYFQAEKDALQCEINMDILCDNVWDFKFVGETDERIEYRIFCRDYKYPLSRVGSLTWGFAYNSAGLLGVQLEDFAVLCPERTSDWGWKLSNGHFVLKSIEKDPDVVTPEKMAERNRRRMVPIIFRLVGHTFIIHAALDTDNPTEEQKQEIVNRVLAQLLLRGNLHTMLRRYYRNQDFMAEIQNEMIPDEEERLREGGDPVPNNEIVDRENEDLHEPLLSQNPPEDFSIPLEDFNIPLEESMDQTQSSDDDNNDIKISETEFKKETDTTTENEKSSIQN